MRNVSGNSLRWEAQEETAVERYPADLGIIGRDDWIELVHRVTGNAEPLGALEAFFDATELKRNTAVNPRIFISHKFHTDDNGYAERVACLAAREKLDFWLDLVDPQLKGKNGQSFSGPQHAVLIAGIIEMALLNCTSVIAIHTIESAKSTWIPYEFGRVKLHIPVSSEAAGWFHPSVWAGVPGEYFELAQKAYGELSVPPGTSTPWNPWQPATDWLKRRPKPVGGGANWSSPTSPLP